MGPEEHFGLLRGTFRDRVRDSATPVVPDEEDVLDLEFLDRVRQDGLRVWVTLDEDVGDLQPVASASPPPFAPHALLRTFRSLKRDPKGTSMIWSWGTLESLQPM